MEPGSINEGRTVICGRAKGRRGVGGGGSVFCLKQKPSDSELMRADRGGQCIVGREASSASRGREIQRWKGKERERVERHSVTAGAT
jgi:hypothetical protein